MNKVAQHWARLGLVRVTVTHRSTQRCILLGSLNRVPALTGWSKGENVTSAGWQVTRCDIPYGTWVPVALRLVANCSGYFTHHCLALVVIAIHKMPIENDNLRHIYYENSHITRKPSGILSSLWGRGRGGRLCSPKKWAKVHQNFFRGCYPLRPPIMPNFIEIGQTSLEIGICRKKNFHTHTDRLTHTRHPDWLSRASQHARGATKNAATIVRRHLQQIKKHRTRNKSSRIEMQTHASSSSSSTSQATCDRDIIHNRVTLTFVLLISFS